MSEKVLLSLTILQVGVAWASFSIHRPPTVPPYLNPAECPPSFKQPPLILVSMDGFRAEYMTRGITPTLLALAKNGVRTPHMKSSYPTITFPNHYTIATGLYPPAHGIIANKFFDPVFNAEFRIGRNVSFEQRWWGGEPIWKTIERQGKVAATLFWPGSAVEGNQATYWFRYNESVPFENRVDQVMHWLELPPGQRPDFMTLYMHEPDSTGHMYGPNTPQVDESLIRVDAMLKRLIEGLQQRNLLPCVNIIILADHGMAEAGKKRNIRVDKYIPNVVQRTRFWPGVFARMTPNDGLLATKHQMLNSLSCRRKEVRIYEKTSLPIRWHMGAQRRVEDIVFDLDAGFTVAGDNTFEIDAGDHGYDNYFHVMNAIFVGYGPSFRHNTEVESFLNIELYNLMSQLVGVTPAPNNGTWGALHHLLKNPPPYPTSNNYYGKTPLVPGLPSEKLLPYQVAVGQCEGDYEDSEELLEVLQESQEDLPTILNEHLPWGIPSMGSFKESILLLPQPDAVTGYSSLIKMPMWTSFTLDAKTRRGSGYALWRSDPRLTDLQSPSCSKYDTVKEFTVSPYPLFPAYYSKRGSSLQLPFLISNAVPVTQQLSKRWKQLLVYVRKWAKQFGSVNVVTGPVFDYDADTFVDNLYNVSSTGGLLVPTHLFMVVTRCLVRVDHIANCPQTYLDALAFVYPQYLTVTNCLSAAMFAREFSATVQDVEKITGLQFFSNLSYQDQVRLRIRIHSNIWGRESWWNRLRSDIFSLQ